MKAGYLFIEHNSKILMLASIALLVVLGATYGVLVRETIVNVVEREKIEAVMVDLTTTIGEMEFDYIARKNTINIDLAYSLGFSDIGDASYLTRTSAVSALSFNQVQ